MLLIMATRWANRQVETVSSAWSDVAATLATMTVLQFPPRLSRSAVVSMLFLKGMCARACPLPLSCTPFMRSGDESSALIAPLYSFVECLEEAQAAHILSFT